MYFYLQFALLLIPLLLSLTEARPQKEIRRTTQPLSLSSYGLYHSGKHQKNTLIYGENVSAHKSHGKIYKGWQKGSKIEKGGSRYYLVKVNPNGNVVVLYNFFSVSATLSQVTKKLLKEKSGEFQKIRITSSHSTTSSI